MNNTRTRRFALLGLAVGLLAAMGFVVLRTGPLAATRVTLAQVHEGSLSPALFGIGTVEARRSWMIGPTAAGRVKTVLVDVGNAVKAGQLLAEMDPVDLEQRLSALDATVARAQSVQAAAQAQQADAAARHELADLNARRNQELADQHFISALALESRLQEKRSADAALQAAQANLRGAGQDLLRTQAERAAAQQLRANVRLLAAADGVVTSRDAEAGSTVVAGQAVLHVIDPLSLWVRLRVDQGRSGGLAAGLQGQIVLRSLPQKPLAAQVARVELLSIALVSFKQAPAGVSVGEMAEVTLQLAPTKRSPVLPNAAIARQGAVGGVWRVESGHARFVPVRLGAASLDGQVQVLEGLKTGDEVVVYSEKALAPGSRVQVVDALVAPAGASR